MLLREMETDRMVGVVKDFGMISINNHMQLYFSIVFV